MKFAILAAALLGTAAVAQTTTADPATEDDGTMTTTADTTGAGTQPMAPSGVNQPVSAPPGARVIVNPDQQSAFAPRPATQDYPPCGAGVTDGCTQTYERGVRRARRP